MRKSQERKRARKPESEEKKTEKEDRRKERYIYTRKTEQDRGDKYPSNVYLSHSTGASGNKLTVPQ